MIRISQFALFGLVVGALAGVSSVARAQSAAAQEGRGKSLWFDRGCDACHSIGSGNRAGPDLKGVTQRRTRDWLKKWLHDPDQMIAGDPLAQQVWKENAKIKMWNPHLSDADAEALIDYLASRSR